MKVSLGERFVRMDGSHPDTVPVPNEHIVTVDWWRTTLDAFLSTGRGTELELFVPYDVKKQKARYELPDGSSYENPLADLHHKSETREGFGDLELSGHYHLDPTTPLGPGWRFSAGLSLPTGRIEENPYELGALGLSHRHIQFGTGTFDPILRVTYARAAKPVDIVATVGMRAPLYENRKGYQGSAVFDLGVGPRVPITDWLALSVQYSALYQTKAYWDGDRDPNSGYFLQALNVAAPISLGKGMVLRPNAFIPLDVNLRGDADNFELEWMVGLTLDISIDRPAAPPSHP